ncbi:hypothetical protein NQU36_29925, partial [Escherichia coli]|uniref:hypothetical protein n=1 Tax=Escherichia coli TaxID=562 RepID=UPI002117E533
SPFAKGMLNYGRCDDEQAIAKTNEMLDVAIRNHSSALRLAREFGVERCGDVPPDVRIDLLGTDGVKSQDPTVFVV